MPASHLGDRVLSWASILDDATAEQALRTARLEIVSGHVALMPDAHLGKGATVGSVIPTAGAIIPSAVGVDIGCGMGAIRTAVTLEQLPDDLRPLLLDIERSVPAGVGRSHEHTHAGQTWLDATLNAAERRPATTLTEKQYATAAAQFGTLGGGNHFIELLHDEDDRVWIMLHSGSRGVGNQLAQQHMRRAKATMKQWLHSLPDPDLAYFVENTPEFDEYVRDLRWAQAYAAGNRGRMLDLVLDRLFWFLRPDQRGSEPQLEVGGRTYTSPRQLETQRVLCHHNYAEREVHDGRSLWITRKGAILARDGTLGIIPGAMGLGSYIVRGKGNAASYHSCSHGAGRTMSRSAAKRMYKAADLAQAMAGRVWLEEKAEALIDEIPGSYKDLDTVMRDQRDLVEIVHRLETLLNYKGTS